MHRINPLITPQQSSFFIKNGHIELEHLLTGAECDLIQEEAKKIRTARAKKTTDPDLIYAASRDLWRVSEPLKQLLTSRKLKNVAGGLTNKSSLRLGCDQWISGSREWTKPAKIKDLFSLQGIACALLIRLTPVPEGVPPPATYELEIGLIPLPAQQGNALIVSPNLLLNFTKLERFDPTDLYIAIYTLPSAVFVHNPDDPANNALRALGYNYGDSLTNPHHPLI